MTLLAAVLLSATACGDGRDGEGSPGGGSAGPNDADESYLEGASWSLGWTVQLAEMAEEQAAAAEVEELAAEIAETTREQAAVVDQWIEEWDVPVVVYSIRGALGPPRVAPEPDFLHLEDLNGAEFDVAWVEAMTDRVEGVISSAEQVLDEGASSEVREFAENVVDVHQEWLDDLADLESSL